MNKYRHMMTYALLLSIVFFASAQMAEFSICLPESDSSSDSNGVKEDIVYLFAHGLRSTFHQAYKFTQGYNKQERWIMSLPLASFNFPDAMNEKHSCDKKEVNLGQKQDMECLNEAYHAVLDEISEEQGIILVGISRGSATILNYAALYKPSNIKAIVVECAFDALENVVRHLLRRFYVHWVPFSKKAGMRITAKQFPQLDCNGIFPIKVVKDIPKEIPIMFIHSARDDVVPINSSRRLYCELKQAGHKDAYLLELASGTHGKALLGKDGESYQYAVHAFYKRYDLPYDDVWAQKGESLLNCCQPLISVVKDRIKKHTYKAKRSPLSLYDDDELEGEDDEIIEFQEETVS